MATKIRLSKSTVTPEDKAAVMAVLDSEYLGIGEQVRLFETQLQTILGTDKTAVAFNSGTAALHVALLALGIGPGDEVLVPTLTFVASFQAISATGATPIACDICPDTLFIDLEDAQTRLTPNTKAIMAVHYASDSQGMPGVYAFAQKNRLRVIEDAAHSFGSVRNGKRIGVEGDIICFSFDGIKNITCGEGGALLTSDAEVLALAKDCRLLGVEKDTEARYAKQRSWNFDVKHQGFRFHMSNINAALGSGQLARLDAIISTRASIAMRYLAAFKSHENIHCLKLDYDHIAPHIFVIRVPAAKRDALKDYLAQHDIESGIHYYPNHLLSKYHTSYSLPQAEEIFPQILTLPCHLDLTPGDQTRVIDCVFDFFRIL